MGEHPTPRALRRFLNGGLPGRKFRQVLAHVARCDECKETLEPDAVLLLGEEESEALPVEAAAYDRPIDRAASRALRLASLLAAEREDAQPAVEALRQGKAFTRLSRKESDRLRGTAMVELLLDLSRSQRHSDPDRMIESAELALYAARRLDPEVYGWSLYVDIRARVWGELANAHRVADDLYGAESALRNAITWAKRGSGDLLLAARLGDLAASLWSDLRRFPLAIEMLERVGEIYEGVNETGLAARAQIKRGIFKGYNGEPRHAILDLVEGLSEIDREAEPALALSALHAIAVNLIECGQYRPARIVLFGSRHLYYENGGPLNLLRLSWLEGWIYSGLGDYEKAEAALQKTRNGFEDAGQHYDAALASLDLAMVWARQGRRADVKRLASELVMTFRRHGIAREAVAALLLTRQDCDDLWVPLESLHERLKAISLLVQELRNRKR